MRRVERRLVSSLLCPTCGGALTLEAFLGDEQRVKEGALVCGACRVWYPVVASVPVLLVFATALHERFASERRDELSRLGELGPPAGSPRPGEESTLRTFTEEWSQVGESDLSFTYSFDELKELNRRVWLRALARPGAPSLARVLEVGCGGGHEARALHEVAGGAEVYAVDLNLAVLGRAASEEPVEGLHYVIASLFDLPFAPESFDLVYSQGVLHHTYSTQAALTEIARFVADAGHLFVWLYAHEDRFGLHGRRAVVTRAMYGAERVLRPPLARAPETVRAAFFGLASRAAHPLLRPRLTHAERWERENTDHFLRDIFSPQFAWRQRWNDVIEWFEELGFEIVDVQSPKAYRELFADRLWGVGLTGRRTRANASS
jgi:SAM-dependent methyltransferase/uncharacterized protein YbaR (Trm112 family)